MSKKFNILKKPNKNQKNLFSVTISENNLTNKMTAKHLNRKIMEYKLKSQT